MQRQIVFLVSLGILLNLFSPLGTAAMENTEAFGAALAQESSFLSVFSVSTVPLMILKEVLRKDIALSDEFKNSAKGKEKGKNNTNKSRTSDISLTSCESGLKWTGKDIEYRTPFCAGAAAAVPVVSHTDLGSTAVFWVLLFLLTCLVLLARSDLPWAVENIHNNRGR